jgi:trehalose/maltose transport system substrate-binding protein
MSFPHLTSKITWINLAALSVVLAMACTAQPGREPVTLTHFRLGWSQSDESETAPNLAREFTKETGIQLLNLPAPETSLDQLDISRKLLKSSSSPDVLAIDVIWPGSLANDLMDLRPYLAEELSMIEPQLIPNYTVDGRLVAVPVSIQTGVLEYRADLLKAYGYDHPPKTWSELERMAQRIQAGERAKGTKDFWGYVWQGADSESLTCNAIEWQAAEGGGGIIDSDRKVSVNNPATIRAWRRARRWIGWISPPGVLDYRELDSISIFDSGRAAFNRVWGAATITHGELFRGAHWRNSLKEPETAYARMPGGQAGSFGALGGSGVSVSLHSAHPQEAIKLVRFLVRAEIESAHREEEAVANARTSHKPPSLSVGLDITRKPSQPRSSVVIRPSAVAGGAYEQVTAAYSRAVHSVLTGQTDAGEAAATLEKRLANVTSFSTPHPMRETGLR